MLLKVQEIINYLGSKDSTNPIYLFLIEDPERPFAQFISENSHHNILRLMITYPDIGIIDFIEKDINNPDLQIIHDNPKALFDIIEKDSDNPMFKIYNEERKRMRKKINDLHDDFVTLLDAKRPMIHWLEYKANFHQLFVDANLTEDEILERRRAWISVTRSPSAPIDIVDDNGDIMFTHPGLMGNVDHTMGKDNWNKFKAYSEANQKMGGTFKADFQRAHINSFLEANDKYKESYNSVGIKELLQISDFFENIDYDGNPVEKEPIDEPVEKQLNVVVNATRVNDSIPKSDDVDLGLYD